ncbi:hypothetical protein C8J56DRAFT_815929, partial [Mycena floridula]
MSYQQEPPSSGTPLITLFDIVGNSSLPWCPNVWRVRFILNYKRLSYHTIWVEIQDVEATLRAMGAAPSCVRSDGTPLYTLPAIVDAKHNLKPISNANDIAEYLESAYPARPVFPTGSRALQALFVHYIREVFMKPLLPIMILIPLTHQRVPECSPEHCLGTMRSGPHREHAWALVKDQFDRLAAILDKNVGDGDGICCFGDELSYADFVLCSILVWIEQMAPLDGWVRVREWNGGRWTRLRERCSDYVNVL